MMVDDAFLCREKEEDEGADQPDRKRGSQDTDKDKGLDTKAPCPGKDRRRYSSK